MNQRLVGLVGVGLAALAFLIYSAAFTVYQTQQALVLQFGNPVRVVAEPGLSFKVPFIQQVEYFERRVLDFDAEPVELILGDQRRLVVDAFTRYRIVDPIGFKQSVGTEASFRQRLEPITISALRSVLGEVPLFTVLSEDRTELMAAIQTAANRALTDFGVEVVDVRIKRADLPAENQQAIFRRMQTEREREAKELRAQGAELAQRIRARADRERRVLLAEAEKQAQILRGEGEAIAVSVFAEAFGRDIDFFEFYRSMQAYRGALANQSTNFVLSPDSEFFKYFAAPPEGLAPVSESVLREVERQADQAVEEAREFTPEILEAEDVLEEAQEGIEAVAPAPIAPIEGDGALAPPLEGEAAPAATPAEEPVVDEGGEADPVLDEQPIEDGAPAPDEAPAEDGQPEALP